MKIYCFGNEYIDSDSMAKKIADELNISGVEFIKTDSVEGLTGDIVILDVVKVIKEVKLLTDLNKIKEFYPITCHDFDLGTELKLRKAIGELDSVKIIGVPMHGDISEIKSQVVKFINEIRGQI